MTTSSSGGGQAPTSAVVLVRRTLRLPPEPESPARARRLLRETLAATDATTWLDAAELACTEVVTNAVLHARTELEVTVEVLAGAVRVLVHDASPVLPVQRAAGVQATTGRGMALVAALTADHGVLDAGPGGKTVWFVVTGSPVEPSDDELLAAWGDADWDLDGLTGPATRPTRTVRLLGLPPELYLASRQHHDELLRELVLHLAEHGGENAHPSVDLDGAAEARGLLSAAVLRALGQQTPLPTTLDVEVEVPPEVVGTFGALQATLDAAERLAAEGRLLSQPALPGVVAVRDWVCGQAVGQLGGAAPTPWSRR